VRNQKLTPQSTTNAEYYAFRVDYRRVTQIAHCLNKLGIPTTPQMLFNSQPPIVSFRHRLCQRIAVLPIAAKYYVTAHMATDGEIDICYVTTAEMVTDLCIKSLPKPTLK